ncbi:MAG TPA: response regulator [Bryobacteraceae bacterium]|nr:response regulator [Bryobacteraceae bacterium]
MTEPVQVFVVDDNSCDVELTLQGFKESTIAPSVVFRFASDGEQAIRQIQDGYQPQFILLDLNLPRIDGPAFLAWLHARDDLNPRPTVVVFSGSNHEPEMSRMLDLGAAGFMTKPLDLDSYFDAIHNVIRRWIVPLADGA